MRRGTLCSSERASTISALCQVPKVLEQSAFVDYTDSDSDTSRDSEDPDSSGLEVSEILLSLHRDLGNLQSLSVTLNCPAIEFDSIGRTRPEASKAKKSHLHHPRNQSRSGYTSGKIEIVVDIDFGTSSVILGRAARPAI